MGRMKNADSLPTMGTLCTPGHTLSLLFPSTQRDNNCNRDGHTHSHTHNTQNEMSFIDIRSKARQNHPTAPYDWKSSHVDVAKAKLLDPFPISPN